MFRKQLVAVGFILSLGLAACAPPAEEPKAEGAEQAAEAPTTPAAEPAAAPAPAPQEAAVAPAPKPKPKPRPVESTPPPPPVCAECGVVATIEPVKQAGEGSGAGAVLGAIAGGVIGHQFGGGKGKDLATAAGAIAGGYGGHVAEKQIRATTYYRVGVNMENGGFQTVNVADPAGIAVGSRVRVVGGNLEPR